MFLQYSATSALYGGTLLPYFLNEGADWNLDIKNLEGQIEHVNILPYFTLIIALQL